MASIDDPLLKIQDGAEHTGRCLVRITYRLVCEPADAVVGHALDEHVVVRGVDGHDAPTAPTSVPVTEATDTFVPVAGRQLRTVERSVRRADLDVEQDWWSSGHGGETNPIAEWHDHLVAHIELTNDGELVDAASTPTVSGSWGVGSARAPR